MDTPLYGDENLKYKKAAIFAFAGVLSLLAAVCIILAIIMSVIPSQTHPLRWPNFIYSAIIIAFVVFDIVLMIWWTRHFYSLDIRFKLIIVFTSIMIVFFCANMLTYVFGMTYLGGTCPKGSTIYIANGKVTCIKSPGIPCFGDTTMCLTFLSDNTFSCLPYNATTGTCGFTD